MREGSYAQIRPGMRVIGRGGDTLGGVQRILVDEGSGIFVGITVEPMLYTQALLVPGDRVERVHEDVVHVDMAEGELKPYESPEARYHRAEQEFEGAA